MKERGKEGPWEGRIWVWKGGARLDSRRVSKKPDPEPLAVDCRLSLSVSDYPLTLCS